MYLIYCFNALLILIVPQIIFKELQFQLQNAKIITSQLEQLVADREAIWLQKRGNHPHRQQSDQPRKRIHRPKSDDDDIIDKLPRRGPGFYNFLGKELFEKYNNVKLTMKEYRDAMDRHNEQINKEKQKHQTDDGLLDNSGKYCKPYDP